MANGTLLPDDVEEILSGAESVSTPAMISAGDVAEVLPTAGLQASDVVEVLPSELTVEAFKRKSEEELRRDKTFSPVLFGAKNRQALLSDPESLNKLVRLYQEQETKGTTLAEKGKALVTGIPVAAGAIVKGAVEATKRGLGTLPTQIPVRVAKAALKGKEGLSKFAEEAVKETAETAASIELAGGSTLDLLRRSAREIKEGVSGIFGAGKKALTSEQWRERFFDDVSGVEQTEKVAQGNGPVLQALNLDADRLKQIGVEVDPAKIEELSAATDPINFIPFGAAVGVVSKVGGKITQKVVARTLSAEQAAKLAESLNKARDIASTGTTLAGKVTGRVAREIGTGIQAAGELGEKAIKAVGPGIGAGLGTGAGISAILGTDIFTALGVTAAARIAPRVTQKAGRGITAAGEVLSGVRPVPGVISAVAGTATEGTKGLAEGLLLSVPFEIGARPEEEVAILGAAGLGGAARAGVSGGARAARAAGAVAQDTLAQTIFRQAEQSEASPSEIYGTEPTLDTSHAATISSLDPQSQKLVNWTRERFRDSGVEIYALDNDTFRNQAGIGNAHGFALDVGETLSPTGEAKPLVRIFLNASAEALPHEMFHALESLDPEGAKTLKDSVLESLTPAQKKSFETYYNTLRNNNKPEAAWTTRLDDVGLASELGAEAFSRVFLGQDLSGVAIPVQRKAALFLSNVLEKLGAPLVREGAPKGVPGISTLGVRPGVESVRVGRQWLQNLLDRVEQNGNILPETPIRSKFFQNLRPEDIIVSRRPVEPTVPPVRAGEITPPVVPTRPPEVTPVRPEVPPNIRVTSEQQRDFSARRAEETGNEKARAAAKTPEERANVESISQDFGKVLEIDHRGVRTVSEPGTPLARTARRAEQEAAYISEGMGAAPESVRTAYQKVFVPVRWEVVGGKPQLIAMSLDKVIANVHKVVKDAVAKGISEKIPYEVSGGKLTDAAWKQVVDDLQNYTENQSNGYRGDGKRLTRPTEDIGASIPAENPGYNPVQIAENKALFLNLLQGLNPPLTARVTGTKLPGNVKAQIIAEINLRQPEAPAVIRPQDIQKQRFKAPLAAVGRAVRETNPLRNELAAAGVPVRELIEVTERINAEDVLSVRPRPDLRFAAPVTDIIRGGFLPGKETEKAIRAGFLPDSRPSQPTPSAEIRTLAENYTKSANVPYTPARVFSGIDSELLKRLADFYDDAESNPNDPTVQASYRALAIETNAQYRAIEAAGYQIEPFTGIGEPYRNSAEAVADIRDNKHLFFLKTEGNFGGEAGALRRTDNSMLADSGITINGQPLLVNDVFRAVHDFFGHGKEGYQFGPRGEFNAWRAHSEMFSPAAQGALAAETLAQNSWVNFGKHLRDPKGNIPQKGQPGYIAPQERPFAEQKNIVIPEALVNEAREVANRTGKFLPDGKSIEEYGRELLNTGPDEWRKVTESMDGGLTSEAYRLGQNIKDRTDVDRLARLRDEASNKGMNLIRSGDMERAIAEVTKGQFFREAYEAATGTGSAGESLRRLLGSEYRPPFPDSARSVAPDLPTVEKSFLPAENFPADIDPVNEAAIRLPSGKIFTGAWHGEAAMKIIDAAGKGELDRVDIPKGGFEETSFGTDGFVTRSGKFLDRAEALKHAQNINQLREEPTDRFAQEGILESTRLSDTRQFLPKWRDIVRDVKEVVEDIGSGLTDLGILPKRSRESVLSEITGTFNPPIGVPDFPIRSTEGTGFKTNRQFVDTVLPGQGSIEPWRKAADFLDDPSSQLSNQPDQKNFVVRLQLLHERKNEQRWLRGFFKGKKKSGPLVESSSIAAENPAVFIPEEDLQTINWSQFRDSLKEDPDSVVFRMSPTEIDFLVDHLSSQGEFPNWNSLSPSEQRKSAYVSRKLTEFIKTQDQGPGIGQFLPRVESEKRGPDWNLKSEQGELNLRLGSPDRWEDIFPTLDFGNRKKVAVISSVEVDSEFRGQGIGRSLVEAAEQKARDEEAEAVFLRAVPVDGEDPSGFYETLGYNQIGEDENGFPFYTKDLGVKGQFLPRVRKTTQRTRAEEISKRSVEEDPFAKYNIDFEKAVAKRKAGGLTPLTSWVLPSNDIVPLKTEFHEGYLAENADELNRRFGTDFSKTANVEERLKALNKGFVRVRFEEPTGTLNVEANYDKWNAKARSRVEKIATDNEDDLSNLRITLLDSKGQVVDSNFSRLFEFEGTEKFDRITETLKAVQGKQFLPSGELSLGLPDPETRVESRVQVASRKFPEAIPIQYTKDENGEVIIKADGKPRATAIEYGFADTPVAREAAKGIRGPEAREEAIATALSEKLIKAVKEAQKNKDIQAGEKWYSTTRSRLRKLLGDDSKFFAELLGATSPRTPVDTNFRFAVDAYNQFKTGKYDAIIEKYREGKNRWESGEIEDFVKEMKNENPNRGQFLDWWIEKHDLKPRQSNGKLFATSSKAVLRVLDGTWSQEVRGPKTPNFAGNLSGQTFEATIDVWAARLLHRLGNEGNPKRWRILPENEAGVTDSDFFLGQKAYRKAAEKLDMKPDALQAILWFFEKDYWEKQGWTQSIGAKKSDFASLLAETEREKGGTLRKKQPQEELALSLKEEDITRKK